MSDTTNRLTPHQLWRERAVWLLDALTDATRDLRESGELLEHLDKHPSLAAGWMLVPDWKGYARFGTGMYVLNHTPAPADPELGAEIIVTLATDKDREGGRKIGETRDTDPNAPPIKPEEMVIRMGFVCPEAIDALEDQLVMLRRENFPDTQPLAVRAALKEQQ